MTIDNDFKKVVIERLDTLPSNKKISIGSSGEYSKDELIKNVKNNTSVGKKIVQIELEFLRSLKEGLLNE